MTSKLARTVVLDRSMNIFSFVTSEERCQDFESGLEEALAPLPRTAIRDTGPLRHSAEPLWACLSPRADVETAPRALEA